MFDTSRALGSITAVRGSGGIHQSDTTEQYWMQSIGNYLRKTETAIANGKKTHHSFRKILFPLKKYDMATLKSEMTVCWTLINFDVYTALGNLYLLRILWSFLFVPFLRVWTKVNLLPFSRWYQVFCAGVSHDEFIFTKHFKTARRQYSLSAAHCATVESIHY